METSAWIPFFLLTHIARANGTALKFSASLDLIFFRICVLALYSSRIQRKRFRTSVSRSHVAGCPGIQSFQKAVSAWSFPSRGRTI